MSTPPDRSKQPAIPEWFGDQHAEPVRKKSSALILIVALVIGGFLFGVTLVLVISTRSSTDVADGAHPSRDDIVVTEEEPAASAEDLPAASAEDLPAASAEDLPGVVAPRDRDAGVGSTPAVGPRNPCNCPASDLVCQMRCASRRDQTGSSSTATGSRRNPSPPRRTPPVGKCNCAPGDLACNMACP